MPSKNYRILTSAPFIVIVFCIIGLVISLQNYLLPFDTTTNSTHYNNYVIFKQSFFHLIHHTNLYQLYPNEQWDYYKYSPTFALLMSPFAVLPDFPGLLAWNLLNLLIFLAALWKIPLPVSGHQRLYMLGFVLLELITSMQNSQCNAFIAGMIIFAFILLERKQVALATLCIALTVFTKIFGLIGILLFIFYPQRLKAALYMAGWMVLLFVLPLIVIPPAELIQQYQNWLVLLKDDHNGSFGISVMGIMHSWFSVNTYKNIFVIAGALLLCLPLLRFRLFNELRYKLFLLSSMLIWVVIFNHKAESATYIIAATGVAIWFFSQKASPVNVILLVTTFILAILSPTEMFPHAVDLKYIVPYTLKALPCILVWLKINYDLLTYSKGDFSESEEKKIKLAG